MKAKKHPRHPYSVKFREEYGRSLTREEIRLVQAYRGLNDSPMGKPLLLNVASLMVLSPAFKTGRAR